MIKHLFLVLSIFASHVVFGKTYIENTQELRNHLQNKTIDKQLIKEYIDELILSKNIQELLEVKNILNEEITLIMRSHGKVLACCGFIAIITRLRPSHLLSEEEKSVLEKYTNIKDLLKYIWNS